MKLFSIKKTSIRTRVMSFTSALLICLLIGYGTVFYVTQDMQRNFDTMFTRSILLKSVASEMTNFEMHLEGYLQTKDSDSLLGYMDSAERLESLSTRLTTGLSQDPSELAMHNMGVMMTRYVEVSQDAIRFKRARNTEATLQAANLVADLSSYIEHAMLTVHITGFDENLEHYLNLNQQMQQIMKLLLWMLLLLVAFGMVFVFDFTLNISAPIEVLSKHAQRIAKGEYGIEVLDDYPYEEATVLTKAFTEMSLSLAHYIEDLKDKATTENKLRLSEVENLKMQNMLKQAELMALQSQINPHFLFNTINAGLQLAIMEDAEQTAQFLDHMARMFRYNIQRLDNTVSLNDEIQNLTHYYHLMKVRFQDMLDIRFDIQSTTDNILMPPMILQPLVENACIHGFKHKETTGQILVSVWQEVESLYLRVSDNGSGMDESTLDELRSTAYRGKPGHISEMGHTTGLGLANVYERLSVFFESRDVMILESTLGMGTSITLKLPKMNQVRE